MTSREGIARSEGVRPSTDQRGGVGRAILFVSASGWLGGPGRSLLTLMANLPETPEMILVSPTNGDLLPALRERSLRVTHIPLYRLRGPFGHPLGRLVAIMRMTSWIVRNRYRLSVIHANGFTELHLAALGALLGRIRCVAWFHAYEVDPWDRRLGPVWGRLLSNRHFTAVSDLAREIVAETGLARPDAISIVPNPIDPREVRTVKGALVDRSRSRRPPVVGYLGSCIRDKGFDLIPDIIRESQDVAVRWAIFVPKPSAKDRAGTRSWAELEALSVGGRVSFPGRKSDVREAYRECDIVICPSRRESFGRIAAEAMTNGLPVVASDIGPFRDLVGDAGLLFPSRDPASAAAGVRRLVKEPALRHQLGRRGEERAARFEPGPIVRRFAELYGLADVAA